MKPSPGPYTRRVIVAVALGALADAVSMPRRNGIGRTPFAAVVAGTWQSIEDAGVLGFRVAGAAGAATDALLYEHE